MSTTTTDLIKGIPDWHQITNENMGILASAIDSNSNKLGDLTGNGITEIDLATAIKNDRTQLSEKANQSDLQSEITNRTNSVSNEKTERQAEIAVERSRINTFTALAAGSTTGDAELIDTRVGANGITYANAGSAVRGQISDINNYCKLSEIQKTDISSTYNASLSKTDQVAYLRDASGTTIVGVESMVGSNVKVIPVSTYWGKKVLINCDIADSTLCGFVLSDNNVNYGVVLASGLDSKVNYELSIPQNAKYLYVNYKSNYSVILEDTKTIQKKISETIDKNKEWYELVEVDNRNGTYMGNSWVYNGVDLANYVTKIYNVSDIGTVKINGVISPNVNIYTLLDKNKNIISAKGSTSQGTTVSNYEVDTSSAYYLAVSSLYNNFGGATGITVYGYTKINSKWKSKKIAWFGTSIPAGGFMGKDNPFAYPFQVGKKLGATVYNEAVGSSAIHSKIFSRISATNPYGFINDFNCASRSLANTVTEMQWIINWINYKINGGTYANTEAWDSNVFTVNVPSSWSSSDTNNTLSFSYENKLNKYLVSNNEVDLFVIDHGYNDDIWNSDDLGLYTSQFATYGRHNMYTLRGAMNFIIDKILNYNPRAKICIIGHYDNQLSAKAPVSEYQQKVATEYEIPLLKLWEKTKWSQVPITTFGAWTSAGVWKNTTTANNFTMLQANLYDGIHPHSDKSGGAIRQLTDIITPFIESN